MCLALSDLSDLILPLKEKVAFLCSVVGPFTCGTYSPATKMVWGFVLVSGLVHFPKDPHVRVVESQ